MSQKTLKVALLVQVLCFGALLFILNSNQSSIAQASTIAYQMATPQPFLGPIYYGQKNITFVFDHEYPLFGGDGEPNNWGMHFDGVRYNPPFSTGYGYDSHIGIDYSLIYEPVLSATSGIVNFAGWSDTSNHRAMYGLHVQVNPSESPDYRIWYGHLSTLVVQTDDEITAPYSSRQRILGVSGNTGKVFGANGDVCGPVDEDPLCGVHLHFEVRQISGNHPVNPYGWIGADGTRDPWSIYIPTSVPGTPTPGPSPTPGPPPILGATSYDLWATRPAVSSGQYGTSGSSLSTPPLENASLIIDDSSPDFDPGTCWSAENDFSTSYNGTYHGAEIVPSVTPTGTPTATPTPHPGICAASWYVEPDAFSPPGEYDIYVHIPDLEQASLDSEYRIYHDEGEHVARVVQAAYPPSATASPWAYIGRYEFAMDNTTIERIELTNETILDDANNVGNYVLADAIQLLPAEAFTPPASTLYFSWANDGVIGSLIYKQEDIVIYDVVNASWSLFFDGSDVGLANINVDAFALLSDGTILLSFDTALEKLDNLADVDEFDIVRFIPSSTGQTTSGSFDLYFDGATYGLGNNDIDAIGFAPTGELLISTAHAFNEPLLGNFSDEDMVYWDTSGFIPAWTIYFDGSDVGLTTDDEDINGFWIDETGLIFLTTPGPFDVTGIDGDGADIFLCTPGSVGSNTTCTYDAQLFWNGSAHGVGFPLGSTPGLSVELDGFWMGQGGSYPTAVFKNGGFEEGLWFWQQWNSSSLIEWLVSTDSHTGLYSAQAHIISDSPLAVATITQNHSSNPVQGNACYQVRMYMKDAGNSQNVQTHVELTWWADNQIVGQIFLFDLTSEQIPGTWQQYVSDVLYAASNVTYTRIEIDVASYARSGMEAVSHSVFFDDIQLVQVFPCNP